MATNIESNLPPLGGLQRFFLAFVAFFRVWFDRAFAEDVWAVKQGRALPAPEAPQASLPEPTPPQAKPEPEPARASDASALQLLSLLQRDGRLVDFLQEDLAGASDADLAAVVRSTVYEGCRKTLAAHLELQPVLDSPEGAQVTVPAGFDPSAIRLTGNVVGDPPFKGTLKHRGWTARAVTLPAPAAGSDPHVVAPAEVELS